MALIYPREGVTHVPAPEVYLAKRMGAEITILDGVVVPWETKTRVPKPYLKVIAAVQAERRKHQKGTLENELWKEVGNSLYGKLLQGLVGKRVYDTHVGESRDMPPSRLTNPYLGCMVTSIVRAAVSEIMELLPRHRQVVSVTTDGMLTDATWEECREATQGPICQMLRRARFELAEASGSQFDPEVIEVKHRASQILCWRTRGQATLGLLDDKPVLAKAGMRAPSECTTAVSENDWIVSRFANRAAFESEVVRTLRGIREIHQKGGDLVNKEIRKSVSMDFDWKRRPHDPTMAEINGVEHVSFWTVPWLNVEEFRVQREEWLSWRESVAAPIKTIQDLTELEDWTASRVTRQAGLRRSTKGGSVKVLIRMFLRAWAKEEAGLTKDRTYAELADDLTSFGFPVSVQDVKNSVQRPFVKGAVPRSAAVETAVGVLTPHFFRCRWDDILEPVK